jgi:hypothetical protein
LVRLAKITTAHGAAGAQVGAGETHGARHDRLPVDQRMHQGMAAHGDDVGHCAFEFTATGARRTRGIQHLQVFGAQHRHAVGQEIFCAARNRGMRDAQANLTAIAGLIADQVGLADEVGDETRSRGAVNLAAGAHLFDASGIHHHDTVGDGHRFFLVVGDENEGDAELGLQVLELQLHALAQFHVQGRERLVEQQQFRLIDDGASQGHALLLPAGQRAGKAILQGFQADHRQGFARLDPGLGAIDPLAPRSVGDVFQDGHMREQRVVLEHGIQRPTVRGQATHILAIDRDAAGIGLHEAGDRAQQGGLATTAGAEQHDEFALLDVQLDVVQRLERPEAFTDAVDAQQN